MSWKYILLLTLAGCAHDLKCGNPDGARVIVEGKSSCKVRIRQVTVGRDMNIPQSLKNSDLASFRLEWVDPILEGGRVDLGHFILLPGGEK